MSCSIKTQTVISFAYVVLGDHYQDNWSQECTLVKNYDLRLEAPGLAEVARAIGSGQDVVLGGSMTMIVVRPFGSDD